MWEHGFLLHKLPYHIYNSCLVTEFLRASHGLGSCLEAATGLKGCSALAGFVGVVVCRRVRGARIVFRGLAEP